MNQQIHPKDLLAQAQQSIDAGWELEDYSDTMWKLRNEGWSFRKIAEWLEKKGVDCSHNQVYYILKQTADVKEAYDEVEIDYRDESRSASEDSDFTPNTH